MWSSDELIGTGGTELPFAAGVNMVGDRRPSGINDHTFAILTVNDVVEGQTRLVSELHVNATVEVPTATVSCHNQQADDDPVTASYVVIGMLVSERKWSYSCRDAGIVRTCEYLSL